MGNLSRSPLWPTEGQAKEGGVNLSARRCELTQFLSSATKGEKRGEMVPRHGLGCRRICHSLSKTLRPLCFHNVQLFESFIILFF